MTDWTPRKFEIDLYFLEKGIDYKAQIYKDGINADRNAMDYKIQKKVFNKKVLSTHTPLLVCLTVIISCFKSCSKNK